MYHVSIDGSQDVRTFAAMVQRKQANECDMCKRVEDAINSSSVLLSYLQEYVRLGMQGTVDLVQEGGLGAFLVAYKDVKVYEYWDNVHNGAVIKEKHPKLFYGHIKKLTESGGASLKALKAQDCSSLIRFYGECIEAGGKMVSVSKDQKMPVAPPDRKAPPALMRYDKESAKKAIEKAKKQEAKRKSYQEKTMAGGLFKKGVGEGMQRRRIQKTTFDEVLSWIRVKLPDLHGILQSAGQYTARHRMERWMKSHSSQAAELLDYTQVLIKNEERQDIAKKDVAIVLLNAAGSWARGRELSTAVKGMAGTGMERWLHLEGDCLAKFNKIFGMRYGATVSGTSCDTMFFMDQVAKLEQKQCKGGARFSPLFFLLAVGGIAAGGHHTTNEVAIPLAVNNQEFNYTIGCYESLFPASGVSGILMKAGSKIKNALVEGEGNDQNRLWLCYYSRRGEPAGFFHFDRKGKDLAEWKKIATITKDKHDIISQVMNFGPSPTKEDILRLAGTFKVNTGEAKDIRMKEYVDQRA